MPSMMHACSDTFLGVEDDGVHRVNWWDAPTNPDVWKKHQVRQVGSDVGMRQPMDMPCGQRGL